MLFRSKSRIILVLLLLGVFAILFGYMTHRNQGLVPAMPTSPALSNEEKCASEGGRWEVSGLLGEFWCIHTFPDGGKACENSDECEGDCVIGFPDGAGHCKKDDNPFGCYATIEAFTNGGGILCRD